MPKFGMCCKTKTVAWTVGCVYTDTGEREREDILIWRLWNDIEGD